MIKKKPFVKYSLEDKKNSVISLWLNDEERAELNRIKKIIKQPKDSTAIKTMMELGSKLIDDPKVAYVIDTLFKNKRNNERSGITEIE